MIPSTTSSIIQQTDFLTWSLRKCVVFYLLPTIHQATKTGSNPGALVDGPRRMLDVRCYGLNTKERKCNSQLQMNYFTHGRRFVHDPFFLAGTAVPDWMSVVNRKSRARARLARPFVDDDDPLVASIARGILQHHDDDHWFHQTAAFAELSLQFTVRIRDRLAADPGFRPSFLGHILVELLLDAVLIEEDIHQLDRYYSAIDSLDTQAVSRTVNRMLTQPTEMLGLFIPRFATERFLYDYLDDAKLLTRLNSVLRRVRLRPLPDSFVAFFPSARQDVARQRQELLQGECLPSESNL